MFEIFYKSNDGKWRVVYSLWDLGRKSTLQHREETSGRPVWRWKGSYEFPGQALTAMNRAAGEWRSEWT